MMYVRNGAGMTIEMEIPLYIAKARIRWDEIEKDSYLRDIPAIAQISELELYFLDEPEAALSPQRQLALLRMIYMCAKRGAQFFIVTHSPILLGMPYAEILGFSKNGIGSLSYEETESYQVTSLFLNQRDRILAQLLEDE